MLKVKLLTETAKAPVVAHPGEDLGFDLFSDESVQLEARELVKVRTGVAVEFPVGMGGIIKDRSSMAAKGVTTHGGVIDNGYRGEIMVIMRGPYSRSFINKGDKIAQLVMIPVLTCPIEVVDELSNTERGVGGFGSTGA